MLRRLLLRASNNERLRQFATSNGVASAQARRFVAGETLDEARAAAAELTAAGRWVSLDHVGEEVTSRVDAIDAADHYVEALGTLSADGLTGRVGVSVKPTQVGLRIDAGLCHEQMARIARAADGAHVTLDMEDHTVTDETLDLVEALRADGHTHVGCAVQVMLHRTRDDVVRMVEQGVSLRLCKGAYAEPTEHALQDAGRIRDRYLQLADLMLAGDGLPRFATHDHVLIDAIRDRITSTTDDERTNPASADDRGNPTMSERQTDDERTNPASADDRGKRTDVEFQLLHGVREPLQEDLVEAGLRTLVYLPYGDEWYPYFVRRLAERPANLLFFLRAMAG